jgi:alpha-N-arabinofuranosidase
MLDEPLSKQLPASMRVSAGNGTSNTSKIGFKNEGYWGMDVRVQTYTGSFWVKGAYDGVFTASLESNLTSDVFGSVEVPSKSVADDWTEHTFELVPEKDAPNSNNTFSITFDGAAASALDFNLIYLQEPQEWSPCRHC